MLNIDVIYVGNTKEQYLLSAIDEYKKRLNQYCKLSLLEIKEYKINDSEKDSEIEIAKNEEGKKILELIKDKSYVISLCVEGKQFTSEDFAKIIESKTNLGYSKIAFIIGGPYGLSDDVKNKSDLKLSLSKMTFTHRIAKVLLLEQIYRAENILAGGKYHK
jgi:23S rRNA (pseudouridine1915-N3)-methyltransferase